MKFYVVMLVVFIFLCSFVSAASVTTTYVIPGNETVVEVVITSDSSAPVNSGGGGGGIPTLQSINLTYSTVMVVGTTEIIILEPLDKNGNRVNVEVAQDFNQSWLRLKKSVVSDGKRVFEYDVLNEGAGKVGKIEYSVRIPFVGSNTLKRDINFLILSPFDEGADKELVFATNSTIIKQSVVPVNESGFEAIITEVSGIPRIITWVLIGLTASILLFAVTYMYYIERKKKRMSK